MRTEKLVQDIQVVVATELEKTLAHAKDMDPGRAAFVLEKLGDAEQQIDAALQKYKKMTFHSFDWTYEDLKALRQMVSGDVKVVNKIAMICKTFT